MLKWAQKLLGHEDANTWYLENIDLFKHPRFLTERIPLAPHVVEVVMEKHGFDDEPTIWAQMHPYWDSRFGLYVVYSDDKVICETRDLNKVWKLLF